MPVQMARERPVTLEVNNLEFGIYNSEEIRQISVCKITNPVSFDSLGNSTKGGLYDNRMGPSVRREFCGTCNHDSNSCEGHIGHIDLVMTCYNPLFMKYVATILKCICSKCKKLQITERMKEIVELQLKLADAGFVAEACDLEEQKIVFCNLSKNSMKVKFEDVEDAEATEKKREKTYVKTMKRLRKLLQDHPVNPYEKTKTSEALRNSIVHSTIGAASSSSTKNKCIHCQKTLRKIRYSYKKLVISLSKHEMEEINRKTDTNISTDSEVQKSSTKVIVANECREYMKEIFENDGDLLKIMFPVLAKAKGEPFDVFFMDIVPVFSPIWRPPNHVRDVLVEHPQTKSYKTIVERNNELFCILTMTKEREGIESSSQISQEIRKEAENVFKLVKGTSANEKIYFKWEELQTAIDMTLDKEANVSQYSVDDAVGIKQMIEKKQGLIRMHMMGKRVNYAARTVITPDPYIDIDYIGIPEAFALKLTYPVAVTPWNVTQLRKMVMNGPDKHPGACYIQTTNGSKRLIPKEASKREAMANTLLKPEKNDGLKFVHRHLLNGDVLLLNRQPTLHRPSIMAHKARILKGEKTFKLHYSNCKSYNADFDGDEMNAHYPQNEVGRSEAYNLVGVENHYLVPKDGTPLGGLIQDHMIAGVKISTRGRFFSKEDYQQLVFQGLSTKTDGKIILLPPTILKPCKLWSGKQVFSTLIINLIPKHKEPINLTSTAKIGDSLWQTNKRRKWRHGGSELTGNQMSETEVVIRFGELLVGVLDKNHYGSTPYSLVHCMYELYGGGVSTRLLSALTRVFTTFLQWEGFTLGVRDILVLSDADKKRREIIDKCKNIGKEVTCQVLDVPKTIDHEELAEKLEEAYATDPKFRAHLDKKYKSALDSFTNDINKTCIPSGLISKFPDNNLQLMVLSGAKGSTVNTMQISCLLGQIELEGKRPPVMINGKSLPSFLITDCSPRAGGYIAERFMTGIEPQGFFFHCMAGREGLIDTAVKTSRSGYLQRCLIKHLEGLTIGYDGTVRDSDKSVVQFMYGEDGMDILKSQFIKPKTMKFLVENQKAIYSEEAVEALRNSPETDDKLKKMSKKIKSYRKKFGSTLQKPARGYSVKKCPTPINSEFSPYTNFGSISECAEEILDKYFKQSKDDSIDNYKVRDMFYLKNMKCLAEPGEPVGLLAAQSIGEPSTQMTLNTFHFAGRGDMNVTLGIPRLREILMVASKAIKTPSMEIAFLNQNSENLTKIAEKFRMRLNQVTLSDVLEFVNVKSWISLRPSRVRNYELTFHFLPRSSYKNQFMVKPKKIINYMHEAYLIRLLKLIEKVSKDTGSDYIEKEQKENSSTKKSNEDEETGQIEEVVKDLNAREDSDDDGDVAMDDDDATTTNRKMKQMDEMDYDDPDVGDDQSEKSDDDDFDLAKVKLEVDENMDVTKLEKLVLGENENADLEHLKELEEKEDKQMGKLNNDDDVSSLLSKKASASCSNITVTDYISDKENHLWCTIKFEVPVRFKNVDLTGVIRDSAKTAIIWEIPKLKRAITFKQNDLLYVKTEGINIEAMLQYDKILDLNKLYTNDIHAVANIYGIEAAARVVIKEVQNVFKVYGITVDPRHLSLISDYMTFDGTFKPLNRKGIESSASPMQQVSFESALQFLKNAAVQGKIDNIDSPSACLMAGHPCKVGTGSFGLINDLSYVLKK